MDCPGEEEKQIAAIQKCTVLTYMQRKGHGHARNYGAKHANGRFFFFIDADVVIAHNAEKIVREELTTADACYGRYITSTRALGRFDIATKPLEPLCLRKSH